MKDETTKPEALRLAKQQRKHAQSLEPYAPGAAFASRNAANELERQHAEIERLRSACQVFLRLMEDDELILHTPIAFYPAERAIRSAIDEAKEARNVG